MIDLPLVEPIEQERKNQLAFNTIDDSYLVIGFG